MADKTIIDVLFVKYKFDIVVNLAVWAGVRCSFENTDVYITSNMMGFYNDHGGIPRIDKLSNRFRVSLRVQGSKFKAGAQAMAFFCDTQE